MKKNKKNLIYSILLLILLFIGIGYAYLTSNLSITGSTEIAANSWNIHFENIQITEGSVAIETGGSAATVNPSDDTEVTYSIKLNRPGDFYEFTVDVKNDGTLDGMIESISSTLSINNATPIEILSDNSNLPAYLNYSVTYSDDIAIEPNHELKAGNKETYKVRVEYKKNITAGQLPQNNSVHLSFGLRPIMVQARANAISPRIIDNGKYTVMGYENIGELLADEEYIRDTPELAIQDWEYITNSSDYLLSYYIKHKLDDNNIILESYIGFIINDSWKETWKEEYCQGDEDCEEIYDSLVNGEYYIKFGEDIETFEANVETIKRAFNYSVNSNLCEYYDFNEIFNCGTTAFHISASQTSVDASTGGFHCNVNDGGYSSCAFQ